MSQSCDSTVGGAFSVRALPPDIVEQVGKSCWFGAIPRGRGVARDPDGGSFVLRFTPSVERVRAAW
jgi:hypothetical protein